MLGITEWVAQGDPNDLELLGLGSANGVALMLLHGRIVSKEESVLVDIDWPAPWHFDFNAQRSSTDGPLPASIGFALASAAIDIGTWEGRSGVPAATKGGLGALSLRPTADGVLLLGETCTRLLNAPAKAKAVTNTITAVTMFRNAPSCQAARASNDEDDWKSCQKDMCDDTTTAEEVKDLQQELQKEMQRPKGYCVYPVRFEMGEVPRRTEACANDAACKRYDVEARCVGQ